LRVPWGSSPSTREGHGKARCLFRKKRESKLEIQPISSASPKENESSHRGAWVAGKKISSRKFKKEKGESEKGGIPTTPPKIPKTGVPLVVGEKKK